LDDDQKYDLVREYLGDNVKEWYLLNANCVHNWHSFKDKMKLYYKYGNQNQQYLDPEVLKQKAFGHPTTTMIQQDKHDITHQPQIHTTFPISKNDKSTLTTNKILPVDKNYGHKTSPTTAQHWISFSGEPHEYGDIAAQWLWQMMKKCDDANIDRLSFIVEHLSGAAFRWYIRNEGQMHS
ncbi:unnamed protein product, partial [Didymodactylos carnosus]